MTMQARKMSENTRCQCFHASHHKIAGYRQARNEQDHRVHGVTSLNDKEGDASQEKAQNRECRPRDASASNSGCPKTGTANSGVVSCAVHRIRGICNQRSPPWCKVSIAAGRPKDPKKWASWRNAQCPPGGNPVEESAETKIRSDQPQCYNDAMRTRGPLFPFCRSSSRFVTVFNEGYRSMIRRFQEFVASGSQGAPKGLVTIMYM